jgi:multidrug efflux pump
MLQAVDYKPLIIGYNNGAAVGCPTSPTFDSAREHSHRRLSERQALDNCHHLPPAGREHHRYRRSHCSRELPSIQASIPQGIKLTVVIDRTTTIRASVSDVERTLMVSVVLVILVVFIFLRNWRATLIPFVAVPVSLIGTFAVMYLLGFSIDNLSLMALTISTGFVVDDAIVVMENISRHREEGMPPFQAALSRAPGRSGSPSSPSACR